MMMTFLSFFQLVFTLLAGKLILQFITPTKIVMIDTIGINTAHTCLIPKLCEDDVFNLTDLSHPKHFGNVLENILLRDNY
jgi:hypothetical protein